MEWVWFSLIAAGFIIGIVLAILKMKNGKKYGKAIKILEILAGGIDVAKGHIPATEKKLPAGLQDLDKALYPHTAFIRMKAREAGVENELDEFLKEVGANKKEEEKPNDEDN